MLCARLTIQNEILGPVQKYTCHNERSTIN